MDSPQDSLDVRALFAAGAGTGTEVPGILEVPGIFFGWGAAGVGAGGGGGNHVRATSASGGLRSIRIESVSQTKFVWTLLCDLEVANGTWNGTIETTNKQESRGVFRFVLFIKMSQGSVGSYKTARRAIAPSTAHRVGRQTYHGDHPEP